MHGSSEILHPVYVGLFEASAKTTAPGFTSLSRRPLAALHLILNQTATDSYGKIVEGMLVKKQGTSRGNLHLQNTPILIPEQHRMMRFLFDRNGSLARGLIDSGL
jgi:hypothetical protein